MESFTNNYKVFLGQHTDILKLKYILLESGIILTTDIFNEDMRKSIDHQYELKLPKEWEDLFVPDTDTTVTKYSKLDDPLVDSIEIKMEKIEEVFETYISMTITINYPSPDALSDLDIKDIRFTLLTDRRTNNRMDTIIMSNKIK